MIVEGRLWISPQGEVVDVADLGLSHGMAVARNPVVFGLPEGHFDEHLRQVDDATMDVDFDFDVAIGLAQARGWVRTGRDGGTGLSIGGRTVRAAQKALGVVVAHGVGYSRLEVEIVRVGNDRLVADHYDLDPGEAELFAEGGVLPRGRRYELPLAATELLDLGRRAAPGGTWR